MPSNTQGDRVDRGWGWAVIGRRGYKGVSGASFCFVVRMIYGKASINMPFLCYRRSEQGNGNMQGGKSMCGDLWNG